MLAHANFHTFSQEMEVHIRLARKSDLCSIIEMSKGIYDGHDYFPHVFLRWVDEPDRSIIVAEKGEAVIGVRAFHIVDEEKTVVSQSLRVHPKYRGQGISNLLILAEQKYVQTHFPCVITERYTTMSTNANRLAIQRKSSGENKLLELGIVAFYVTSQTVLSTPKTVQKDAKDVSLSEPRNINTLEFQKFIEEGRLSDVLTKDTLVIDWEPFKAISCNITCGLVKEDDCLLVSQQNQSKNIICLSHGRLSPRVKCPHWAATFYTDSEQLLKIHIAKQLEYAILQARNKKFIFSCFLPPYFVSDAKKFILEKFSLEYVDFFNFNLLLFEKDFDV